MNKNAFTGQYNLLNPKNRGIRTTSRRAIIHSVTVPYRGEFTKNFSEKDPSVPYRGATTVPYRGGFRGPYNGFFFKICSFL